MEVGVGGETLQHITVCRFFYLFYRDILTSIFLIFISQSFREKLTVYGKFTLPCDHANMTICILPDLDVLYPPLRAHLETYDI